MAGIDYNENLVFIQGIWLREEKEKKWDDQGLLFFAFCLFFFVVFFFLFCFFFFFLFNIYKGGQVKNLLKKWTKIY